MDPISHIALGRTLASLDTRRRFGTGAATACILGALCPDLDILRTLQGWDVYLVHHQSGTHSLPGAVGCGVLTGTVVRAFARRGRWAALVAAGTIGAVSHVLLDLVAGADVKMFAPAWSHAFSLPLFAMADPWLLGTLLIAALLSWRGRPEGLRYGAGSWTRSKAEGGRAKTDVESSVVAQGFSPAARTPVAQGFSPARHRRSSVFVGIALVALVIAAKGVLFGRASAIEHRAVSQGTSAHVEAVFGSWTRWTFIEVRPETLEWWDVDVRGGTALREAPVPRGLDTPLVQRSRALPTVANLLISHDDTFARVLPGANGGYDVRWSALRYCRVGPSGSDPVCGLWFGGEYDRRGRATAAVVRVGSLVQRRSPGRVSSDNE